MVEETTIDNKVENYKFDAAAGKVLQLVINSLYTNREVFLRELVSNASDACEKLQYQAVLEPKLLEDDSELKITISFNADKKILTVSDNGIGMSKEELKNNLGTIARSGTQNFIEALQNKKENNLELIGQFGVGFYSIFMVADKVEVTSRKSGDKEGHIWKSRGDGEFTIEQADGVISRGTTVSLHLKPEEDAYLDKFRIEHIVTTYTDHISYPIELINDKGEAEKLNTASAIWTRNKSDITDEQHQDFFRSVARVGGSPWMILHNKNEGAIEFTNLLYVPTIKPFDLFHPDRKCSLKLYIKKVFITEDNVNIIPQYLRFLRGVVDCADLPLNISRETLQNNAVISKIKSALTKKVISELGKKAESEPEEYKKFWNNFGAVLKEGLCEGMPTDEKERLLSVCRFNNSKSSELTSVNDYMKNMEEGQEFIYYLTASSIESAKKSPQLEGFASRNLNVLLLTDPVDDFWTNVTTEYKNVKLKSITRTDIDLEKFAPKEDGEPEVSHEDDEKKINDLIEYVKKTLDKKVSSVRVSKKLTGSPVCLAVQEGAMDIRMERFMIEQKQLHNKSAKILEINTKHPVIRKLLDDGKCDDSVDIINLLFDQACIIEGEEISDPSEFARRLNKFISA
ncbi:MAG: molecular chaperone HtpG [Rickettsiaceae bacterium H1]|nr:molecular chaperone HtpG [Rickettsiaceae bacterium H1]